MDANISFTYETKKHETKEPAFHLATGEVVYVDASAKVYHNNGRLKAKSLFSQNQLLFVFDWPVSIVKNTSATSVWQPHFTYAEPETIYNFMIASAEKMGTKDWKIVVDVAKLCWEQFGSCLIRISSDKVEFAHKNESEALRMKESNTMVDIMASLLADNANHQFDNLFVDWRVTILPVASADFVFPALQSPEKVSWDSTEEREIDFDHLPVPSDLDGLDLQRNPAGGGLQWILHSLQELLSKKGSNTLEVLNKMADENASHYKFLCQKMEEVHNTLKSVQEQLEKLQRSNMPHMSSSVTPTQLQETDGEAQDESDDETDESDEETDGSDEEKDAHDELADRRGMQDLLCDAEESERSQPSSDYEHAHSSENEQMHQKSSKEEEMSHSEIRANVLHSSRKSSLSSTEEHELPHSRERSPARTPDSFHRRGGAFEHKSLTDKENAQLHKSLEKAYEDDLTPPPRAKKSYHTMLCLDISASMSEEDAYCQMVSIVHKFLDGVEDVVTETGVEENVGLVTFGGKARVVQNLTNDLSRIRDCVDSIVLKGKSPFVEALMVSMAAFVKKASVISISGEYNVKPRIIFISDGQPTENYDGDGPDVPINASNVRTSLTRLMMDFAIKEQYAKISPVFYIPVGKKADKELLKSMATLSGGTYFDPKEEEKLITKLCNHFCVQETIGKTLSMVRKREPTALGAIISSLASHLSKEEQEHVAEVVKKEMENPSRRKRKTKPDNFDDVFEDTDKVNAGERLPLGTRVVRGPDWSWHDQDGEGPGTVLNHSENVVTYVLWDNGHYNRYFYSPEKNNLDIWRTEDLPRLPDKGGELEIGMVVEKGPDWDYDSVHPNVKTGVVIRKCRKNKKMMVRWDNGEMQTVRWGKDDKFDVQLCVPSKHPSSRDLDVGSTPFSQRQGNSHNGDYLQNRDEGAAIQTFEHGQWEWMAEDGNWCKYSEENSATLEQAYKKRPNGSCIVKRDGLNRRIMFKKMTEKVIDGGVECMVKRVPVPKR